MIQTSESIDKLAPALAKAQAEFKIANKTAKNPFLKNSYSNLSDIYQAVRPALAANSIAVLQSSDVIEGNILVTETRLLHSSGQWLQTATSMFVGKTDPQSIGSLLSYSRRYGITQALSIDTGELDDDGNLASNTGSVKTQSATLVAKALKAKKVEAKDDF
jgi:hypothetical protein